MNLSTKYITGEGALQVLSEYKPLLVIGLKKCSSAKELRELLRPENEAVKRAAIAAFNYLKGE